MQWTPPDHLVGRLLGFREIKQWLATNCTARKCFCLFLIMALRPSLARSVGIIRRAPRANGFQRRWQSNPRINQASQASYTTGTVLLFSAFAGSVAFTYGTRIGSRVPEIVIWGDTVRATWSYLMFLFRHGL